MSPSASRSTLPFGLFSAGPSDRRSRAISVGSRPLIRRTVTKTSPVLLPQLPASVNQAQVTVDSTGFSLRAMNDDRTTEVTIGIVVPGNSNLGAANKTIAFRRFAAEYQYIAADPTSWRSLWWIEPT
jgi:hypothetical protein